MQGTLTKATSKSLAEIQEELNEWETEHRRVQALRPLNNTVVELTTKEIPLLEEQIKEKETARPHLVETAESVNTLYFFSQPSVHNSLSGNREPWTCHSWPQANQLAEGYGQYNTTTPERIW